MLIRLRYFPLLGREQLRRHAQQQGRVWPLDDEEDEGVDRELLSGPVRPVPAHDPNRRVTSPPAAPAGKAFVCELEDVSLIGEKPAVVTADGSIVIDSIAPDKGANDRLERTLSRIVRAHGFRLTRSGLHDIPVPEDRRLGTVCLLVNGLQRSYYHWVLEQLTKLRAVEHYREQTGQTPELVLPPGRYPWMRELIHLVGFGDAPTSKWRYGTRAQAERLVLPTFSGPSRANCHWLRERVVSSAEAGVETRPEGGRILILRGDSENPWRRAIVNEAEVVSALEGLGFTAYKLGAMSVAAQARLFAGAEAVVGAHGAGLTNMIFSTSIKVVELFGRDVRPHYFRLAQVAGVPYRYMLCDPAPVKELQRPDTEDPPRSEPRKANRTPGLRVDVVELRGLLTQIGIE